MASHGISGKDGDVVKDGISMYEAKKWSFNPKSNNPAYASNCTNGFKKRVTGVRDASGTVEGVWDPGNPVWGTGAGQIIDGANIILNLFVDQYQYFVVPAVVDSFKMDVDMDSGDIVGWTFDWSLDGEWNVSVGGNEESSNSSSSSSSSSVHSSSSSSS